MNRPGSGGKCTSHRSLDLHPQQGHLRSRIAVPGLPEIRRWSSVHIAARHHDHDAARPQRAFGSGSTKLIARGRLYMGRETKTTGARTPKRKVTELGCLPPDHPINSEPLRSYSLRSRLPTVRDARSTALRGRLKACSGQQRRRWSEVRVGAGAPINAPRARGRSGPGRPAHVSLRVLSSWASRRSSSRSTWRRASSLSLPSRNSVLISCRSAGARHAQAAYASDG